MKWIRNSRIRPSPGTESVNLNRVLVASSSSQDVGDDCSCERLEEEKPAESEASLEAHKQQIFRDPVNVERFRPTCRAGHEDGGGYRGGQGQAGSVRGPSGKMAPASEELRHLLEASDGVSVVDHRPDDPHGLLHDLRGLRLQLARGV